MEKLYWSGEGQAPLSAIGRALELHRLHAPALSRHPRIPGLLQRYRQAIAQTSHRTISLGVPAICTACALRGAVCCFRGVERRYDQYLLLENLLLGGAEDWQTCGGASCFYCGDKGCTLPAKHSFCLNYYCPAIKDELGAPALAALGGQVGRELNCQWELERVLMPWLWARALYGRGHFSTRPGTPQAPWGLVPQNARAKPAGSDFCRLPRFQNLFLYAALAGKLFLALS